MAVAGTILAAVSMYIYVGTFTPPDGTADGLLVYHFDATTWALSLVQTAITPSPSFLAFDSDKNLLYSVNELPQGTVTSFRIDPVNGTLTAISTKSSEGSSPTHITIDPSGRFVLVGNYGSGTAAVLPVATDGTLSDASDTWQDDNSDPIHVPRAHMLSFDKTVGNVALVDLGLDKTFIFRFDSSAGLLKPEYQDDNVTLEHAAAPSPGAGPRHIAFSSDSRFAYIINELFSSVTTYSYDADAATFRQLATVSTLPLDFPPNETNSGAELALSADGRFLYTSNRGHDSIAVFSVDSDTGLLTPIGHESTRGQKPRFFAIDPTGAYLWVANQESNNIVVLAIDISTGLLSYTGYEYSVPTPVCLVFSPTA